MMKMRLHVPVFLLATSLACGAVSTATSQDASQDSPAPTHSIKLLAPLDATKSLENRLEAKATLRADGATLQSFAETLAHLIDFPVLLAKKHLEEAAISPQTPMAYSLRSVRLRTALRLILGEMGLVYVIKGDALQITVYETGCEGNVTYVYDCRELLKLPSPIKKIVYERPFVVSAGTIPKPGKVMQDAGPDGGYDTGDLLELLSITVESDSWEDVGGPGTISEFKGLVVISQTPTVHEKVEQLLSALQKAGGIEGKVKVYK